MSITTIKFTRNALRVFGVQFSGCKSVEIYHNPDVWRLGLFFYYSSSGHEAIIYNEQASHRQKIFSGPVGDLGSLLIYSLSINKSSNRDVYAGAWSLI
jgi:hypothetical protein